MTVDTSRWILKQSRSELAGTAARRFGRRWCSPRWPARLRPRTVRTPQALALLERDAPT
ncbi:hypothetical protein [Streptomyces sp. NPDC048277]|uniref:hypothetical protein n=1 Tax=Streptomyces sp. NPDC048277 TaxID=3155027 RepID=UPI0033EBCE5D